ncbi:hypothetical protein EJ08DRAFT_648436, partial [Tothia fuscella]
MPMQIVIGGSKQLLDKFSRPLRGPLSCATLRLATHRVVNEWVWGSSWKSAWAC